MTGSIPEMIDHVNGVKDDNRWANLRVTDKFSNQWNVGISKRNKTGYKGVSFLKRDNVYQATISYKGKNRRIGSFATAEEAHAAYVREAKILHGEFYRED